jgi:hypothetical protein
MTDQSGSSDAGKWEQLNRCPECGADMERAAQVGEQIGLYYRCPAHGRFRYSWDDDRLEPVPSINPPINPPINDDTR